MVNLVPRHHLHEIESPPCAECDGVGIVACYGCEFFPLPGCSDCGGTKLVDCHACHGTGDRDEEVAEQNAIDARNEHTGDAE